MITNHHRADTDIDDSSSDSNLISYQGVDLVNESDRPKQQLKSRCCHIGT